MERFVCRISIVRRTLRITEANNMIILTTASVNIGARLLVLYLLQETPLLHQTPQFCLISSCPLRFPKRTLGNERNEKAPDRSHLARNVRDNLILIRAKMAERVCERWFSYGWLSSLRGSWKSCTGWALAWFAVSGSDNLLRIYFKRKYKIVYRWF